MAKIAKTVPFFVFSTFCFIGNTALTETSFSEVSEDIEKMFSKEMSKEERGILFETTVEVDASSEPCVINFSETTKRDGQPFTQFKVRIDVRNLDVEMLRQLPSYLSDAPADLLDRIVYFKGNFTEEVRREGSALEDMPSSVLGKCDQRGCTANSNIFAHFSVANDASGYMLIEELYSLCEE